MKLDPEDLQQILNRIEALEYRQKLQEELLESIFKEAKKQGQEEEEEDEIINEPTPKTGKKEVTLKE